MIRFDVFTSDFFSTYFSFVSKRFWFLIALSWSSCFNEDAEEELDEDDEADDDDKIRVECSFKSISCF